MVPWDAKTVSRLDEAGWLWQIENRVKTSLLLSLALCFMCAATASAQTERTVSVGGKVFSIVVPMGYSFDSRANPDDSISMLLDNPVWGIQIQVVIAYRNEKAITTRQWQESKLIEHMAEVLSRAREDDYLFQPLSPTKGTGIYCTFSAPALDAGHAPEEIDVPYLTGGVKTWPRCVVLFKIQSRDLKSPEYQEALELFNWSFTE